MENSAGQLKVAKRRTARSARTREVVGVLALAATVTLALVAGAYWTVDLLLFSIANETSFADASAGVGTLISSLALAGLITALVLQQKELQLQRRELGLLRREHSKARAEVAQQGRTMAREVFERSFLQLLQLHRSTVRDTPARMGRPHERGAAIFRGAVEYLDEYAVRSLVAMQAPLGHIRETLLSEMHDVAFSPEADLTHYFDSTEGLFSFIEASRLPSDEQMAYSRILRAHLTEPERCLIVAWGLASSGELLRLAIHFGLLEDFLRPSFRILADRLPEELTP